jgi:DNA polymerase-3 subunit delta'
LLAALPSVDALALHALGDALGRADPLAFAAFVDTVREWLSARLGRGAGEPARLAQVAEVWEKLNGAAREVEVFNLDRKPMVFAVFGLLAEAAR